MKTLIIPDIHTRFDKAEAIISSIDHDNIVFLGDYFDEFYDTLAQNQQAAHWLKESMKKKDRIHLLGNHDLAYMDQDHRCSGFTENKLVAIESSGVDLTKLQHYCWVGDWLCTHAGLSNNFYKYNQKCPSPIDKDECVNVNNFLHNMEDEDKDLLYNVSIHRGGRSKFGGILWCDYDEFIDIDHIKQIFGHTKSNEVRQRQDPMHDSEHYCIDTGLKHFALHDSDGDGMEIMKL